MNTQHRLGLNRMDLRQRPGLRNRIYKIGTWNVRTLNRPGSLKELIAEAKKGGLDIIALQEVRWLGTGRIKKRDNGERLINFAVSRNLTIMSTVFPHKAIHKHTWCSPDGSVSNQIDHILISNRHYNNVNDVRSYRGLDISSDRYLVIMKLKQRIKADIKIKVGEKKAQAWDLDTLRDENVSKQYSQKINELLQGISNGTSETCEIDSRIRYLII